MLQNDVNKAFLARFCDGFNIFSSSNFAQIYFLLLKLAKCKMSEQTPTLPLDIDAIDPLLTDDAIQHAIHDLQHSEQPVAPEIYLKLWIQSLKIQGFATLTLQAYQRDIQHFLNYCERHQYDLAQLEKADLRGYLRYCSEQQHWQNRTLQRVLTSIRQFMRWLNQQQVQANSLNIQLKRQKRALPGLLSVQQVQQFLDTPAPPQTQHYAYTLWLRDTAMFELMYASGLRISEVANLTWKMLDWSQNHVRILGKGNKIRQVPVHQTAKTALQLWRLHREQLDISPAFKHSEFVFISRQNAPISIRQIQYRIKVRAKQAGLDADIYPHLLRHCFATHILINDGELRTVQDMLGHQNLSTTQVYTHLDFKKLQSKYNASHPKAKRQPKPE